MFLLKSVYCSEDAPIVHVAQVRNRCHTWFLTFFLLHISSINKHCHWYVQNTCPDVLFSHPYCHHSCSSLPTNLTNLPPLLLSSLPFPPHCGLNDLTSFHSSPNRYSMLPLWGTGWSCMTWPFPLPPSSHATFSPRLYAPATPASFQVLQPSHAIPNQGQTFVLPSAQDG